MVMAVSRNTTGIPTMIPLFFTKPWLLNLERVSFEVDRPERGIKVTNYGREFTGQEAALDPSAGNEPRVCNTYIESFNATKVGTRTMQYYK